MNSINTEEIMAEIRRDIKDKGLSADMLSFEDIPYRKPVQACSTGDISGEEYSNKLGWLKAHYYIQPYKQLAGNAVSVLAKKVIRKMTKFYVEPVVFEQNDFNANMVSVADSLTEANKRLEKRIEALEAENRELREKLAASGKRRRR